MQVSKVLVVDGDRTARDALVTCLKFVGVDAHGADSAAAARYWLNTDAADVLVLSDDLADGVPEDLLPPAGQCTASIIMLTRGEVASLSYHADDTLRRPIPVSRVVERVEALIHERSLRDGELLRFGCLAVDLNRGLALSAGRQVSVGHTEMRLLEFFMRHPERVFSRTVLLQRLWPARVHVEERTVDVHIRRLRLALAELGCEGYIQTVRGSGYRFSIFS